MRDGVLTYGTTDNSSVDAARENFIGAAFNTLSFCCTPIEMLSNDGEDTVISTASGFFWREGTQAFLVTNWHVASGKNIFTMQPMSKQGYLPSRFAYYGVEMTVSGGVVQVVRQRHVLALTELALEAVSAPPIVNGNPIDVFAFPIPASHVLAKDPARVGFVGAEAVTGFLNETADQKIVTLAGDDCFILGYPLRNYDGANLPIWKRGAISSETNIGVGNRPIFLVDAATTTGMSGSPIIRKVVTFTADNRDIGALQEFTAFQFIGIYAGRLESKALEATNIGYGWYMTLVSEHLAAHPMRGLWSSEPLETQ